jgi:tetratricopeptide (TPR) repeat protein
VPKRDSERRSFKSDKAAKARYLLGVGSLEQAQLLAERALAEDDTHSLAASILDQRGEWQASLAHLRRAHELMPDGPQVRLNLAMALLRLGSYYEGLPLYEARLDKTTWSGFATLESRTALRHRLLGPGETVEGRRILLLAEQGLGDSIMCARYIPLLANRGARIIVASKPDVGSVFCAYSRHRDVAVAASRSAFGADQPHGAAVRRMAAGVEPAALVRHRPVERAGAWAVLARGRQPHCCVAQPARRRRTPGRSELRVLTRVS